MEQIERIRKMESLFDKSGKIIEQLEQAIDNFSSLQPAIGELEAYYSSDWRTDFEAEEAGEPEDNSDAVEGDDQDESNR